MNNLLTAPVQIVPLHNYQVWYTPAGFPSVETNADLIDGDGDLLLISNGWRYKIISVGQVARIVTACAQESNELYEIEREAYNAQR